MDHEIDIFKKKHNNIMIFEKSKGIGGRSATRRILDYKFDHKLLESKHRVHHLEGHQTR